VKSYCRQIAVNVWFDYYSMKQELSEEYVWKHPTCEIVEKLRTLKSRCVNPF